PNTFKNIAPGTVIYRNSDAEFIRLVERDDSAIRKIGVNLTFTETNDGFMLVAMDEDGHQSISSFESVKELAKNEESTIPNIKKNLSKATEKELPFFKAIPDYLDALVVSCRALTEIAQFKQDKLEKKEGRSVFSFSKLLKSYENAQDQLVRKGAFVQVHWMEIN
ncbi:MAG TPA: DUF3656 domain-containing protein, partial [Fibrobacteraceae bacterium]|nr:DUF3656 domain-containing protein [Fibrobacteraceae bacterium]